VLIFSIQKIKGFAKMIPFPLQTHFWGYIPIKDF